MALDALVDSTQLDSDLTSVANAIRAKSGGSGQLAFPSGFVSEIGDIPTGGGDFLDPAYPSGEIHSTYAGEVPEYAVSNRTGITKIYAPLVSVYRASSFYAFKGTNIYLPLAQQKPYSNNCFASSPNLEVIALPSATNSFYSYYFQNCPKLRAVDCVTDAFYQISGFNGCTVLTTLVLRRSAVVTLANANWFDGTPFASGGSGGTIYIPKSLYDHLGDGSSNDYKAATNWSTVDGRGTITWAKIEGSIYETQYADGTLIA